VNVSYDGKYFYYKTDMWMCHMTVNISWL
jgi:hypothetical protein